jgi:hypothetical protein
MPYVVQKLQKNDLKVLKNYELKKKKKKKMHLELKMRKNGK